MRCPYCKRVFTAWARRQLIKAGWGILSGKVKYQSHMKKLTEQRAQFAVTSMHRLAEVRRLKKQVHKLEDELSKARQVGFKL